MYAHYFGLRELPFNNTPDPRFFFSTPDHEEALATLIYAVAESKGFALLTGEVGSGKTLVSRLMLRHFGERISFATINHSCLSAADLIGLIAVEFKLNVDPDDRPAKLIRALQDHLLGKFSAGVPTVLVLDEAQNLPRDAFELLRTIGNLEADDAKLLQIVILGQPELRQRFQSPDMRQLRQRLFRAFHLHALDREQCEAYIRHRLNVAAGHDVELFAPPAIDVVHRFSQGLPRLINTVCDNAMLSAYSAETRTIDRPFLETVLAQIAPIEEVASQIPTPAPPPVEARPPQPATHTCSRWPAAHQELQNAAPPVAVPVAAPKPPEPRRVNTTWPSRAEQRLAALEQATADLLEHNRNHTLQTKNCTEEIRLVETSVRAILHDNIDQAERIERLADSAEAACQSARQALERITSRLSETRRRSAATQEPPGNPEQESADQEPADQEKPVRVEPSPGPRIVVASTATSPATSDPTEAAHFAASQRLLDLLDRSRSVLGSLGTVLQVGRADPHERAPTTSVPRGAAPRCPGEKTDCPTEVLAQQIGALADYAEGLS